MFVVSDCGLPVTVSPVNKASRLLLSIVKKSDVLAVINELIEVMTDKLQNSFTVKLDGFGTFKIGLKTVGADKAENFSISRNVAGLRVNFISTGKKSQATNKIERTFLQGATLMKYDPTKVEVKKPGKTARKMLMRSLQSLFCRDIWIIYQIIRKN